ncbi:helix-turn-helix transcriptional regulator [Actinomadura sediminis]|uniref:Helix-turn-helix transcriptional regulator n=1 Tax=Actinomadura sediminis TaxID=1038904 RepID=A0ABW3EPL2_9ACTN
MIAEPDYTVRINVRPHRYKAGLSQNQLARAMGVSTVTVAGWDAGKQPAAMYLPRLAEVLGVRIEDLYQKEDN